MGREPGDAADDVFAEHFADRAYAANDVGPNPDEADAAEPLEDNEPSTTPPPWQSRLIAAPPAWYSQRPPNRNWLLRDMRTTAAHGVFPLGKVGQSIAEGGAGKTMSACQLAISVATGAAYLGYLSVASVGRVLLVLGEEDHEESQRRLYQAAAAAHAIPPEGSIVVLPLAGVPAPMIEDDDAGNFREAPFARWLREYVEREDFRLVVVDPLSRFGGRDAETDNAAGTRFIQCLESMVSPTRSVLNVHHVNKMSRGKSATVDASSGRGSSSLVDGARWQCALSVESLKMDDPDATERLGEIVTFAVTKSNYARKPEPILLRRCGEYGGALIALDDADLETVEAARGRSPKREARQAESEAAKLRENDAAVQAVAALPGINWSKLCVRVGAISGCSERAARRAIECMADRFRIEPGPNKSTLYFLRNE